MDAGLLPQLTESLADPSGLRRIVFSGPRHGNQDLAQKVTVRPVELRGAIVFQFSMTDAKKRVTVKNHALPLAHEELARVVALDFRHITVLRTQDTVRFDVEADGAVKRSTSAPEPMAVRGELHHDREKNTILHLDNSRKVLSVLGFLSDGGAIKPTMQRKLRQVNEFVRLLDESTLPEAAGTEPLRVVDCGCGNAYLTFAAYHFMTALKERNVVLTGVDRDADAVARNNEKARVLGAPGIQFIQSAFSEYVPPAAPDIVLSLHACDTATDEAMAGAIRWKSRLVLCAPCCHHHLNNQLKKNHDTIMTSSMARHGILVEKMGDVLTDLFRVLILSVMGYQVNTIKFVDPDNTERNTLIRAELPPHPADHGAASPAAAQYRGLKELWHVTPFLEEALGSVFREKLETLSL
jgi:SAM-dependent methyltransferase